MLLSKWHTLFKYQSLFLSLEKKIFPGLCFNPEAFEAFSFHVPLTFFNMGQFLSFSINLYILSFMTLTFLKNKSIYFLECPQFVFVWYIFIIRFESCFFGRKTTEVTLNFLSALYKGHMTVISNYWARPHLHSAKHYFPPILQKHMFQAACV